MQAYFLSCARPSLKLILNGPKMVNIQLLSSLHSMVDSLVSKSVITRHSEKESKDLCDAYYLADRESREALLRHIAGKYCVTSSQAIKYVNMFNESKDREEDVDGLMAIDRLSANLTPQYTNLFYQIARLEDGVKFLVNLRSDVLTAISSSPLDKTSKVQLRSLSSKIHDWLSRWFSVGLLHLERMTWNSPTSMLQKISDYEAVHPMGSWTDLKRRVGPYRRCYVYTHSCLPREPVVILHVALMNHIANSIQDIIKRTHYSHDEESLASLDLYAAKEDPSQISTAIFYSISSTQKGLQGIELGNQLIKRVVREIKSEFPQITRFSTLSPIPNFNEYLLLELQNLQKGNTKARWFFTSEELDALKKYLLGERHEDIELWPVLIRHLKSNGWIHDERLTQLLHIPLMRKCAHYLYNEKRRGYAANSVANFHLRNGAVLWRLNWLADPSSRGLTNSCGMMVNYRYFLDETENNSQLYIEEKQIQASEKFLELIKTPASML